MVLEVCFWSRLKVVEFFVTKRMGTRLLAARAPLPRMFCGLWSPMSPAEVAELIEMSLGGRNRLVSLISTHVDAVCIHIR